MFDVFKFFIPMSRTISVINESGACFFFTRIKLVARVLACARAMARIKWIRLGEVSTKSHHKKTD